jgi:hypothetical protein
MTLKRAFVWLTLACILAKPVSMIPWGVHWPTFRGKFFMFSEVVWNNIGLGDWAASQSAELEAYTAKERIEIGAWHSDTMGGMCGSALVVLTFMLFLYAVFKAFQWSAKPQPVRLHDEP